ncbi:MAG: hypothetical protein ACKO1M_08950 [Planctomycetota bacterium]
MRTTLLALVALAFLRTVIGLHFFLEGVSHLRDPAWSSVGFRKAAVGPLAPRYRALLPETGDWSATLGAADRRPADEASAAWEKSVVAGWETRLVDRLRVVSLPEEKLEAAKAALDASRKELAGWLAGLRPDLADYRLELVRLADKESTKAAAEVPFERERVAKKQRELAGKASAWMSEAAAMGRRLEAIWDEALPAADREKLAAVAPKTALWKGDRFVSWSLVTIGACLVLGLLVKFNAMGGALFLATVVASQPFWVPGAQATYDQWVELAALLALAALPTGGWSGLDYFLQPWLSTRCRLAGGCCGAATTRGH